MSSVTVIHLVHVPARRNRSSVWIVPGSLDDFEDPVNEDRYPHITDYLAQRGIIVAAMVKPDVAARLAEDTIGKFHQAGIEAIGIALCDD